MTIEHVEASYPLSPVQEGMLFHHVKAPGSGVDIEQMVATLREAIDEAALAKAWQWILERHGALRTRFRWEGVPRPIQEVLRRVSVPLARHDWTGIGPEEQAHRLAAFLRNDREQGVDLSAPPLMRLNLFRLGEAEHRLVWTFPHILLDGGSFPIVVEEVFRAYEAIRRGETPTATERRPYADHIAWLEQELSARQAEAKTFWRGSLAGVSAANELPSRSSGAVSSPDDRLYRERVIQLSRETTSKLVAVAERHELTMNTFVQAAWALVLGDFTGDDDLVFGVVRACRRTALPDADRMVGLFINTVPLRISLRHDAKVTEWLAEIRRSYAAIRPFEHTPLLMAQGESDVATGTPLFHTAIVFNDGLMHSKMRALGPDWQARDFDWIEQTNYRLTLFAYAESELLLKLAYDPAQIDDDLIERISSRLETALLVLAENPEARLGALERTPHSELLQLASWNATETPLPRELCIHALFEEQVRRTPQATAVVFRNQTLSYGELDARANRLAFRLRALGVGPDVRVGIYVERSIEMMVGLLGILKAGGAYVPLDPNYPTERVAIMLEDAHAPVIVTESRLVPRLPSERSAELVMLDAPERGEEDPGSPSSGVAPHNLAYVIFTSGSTGRPKGVMVEHRNVANFSWGWTTALAASPASGWPLPASRSTSRCSSFSGP